MAAATSEKKAKKDKVVKVVYRVIENPGQDTIVEVVVSKMTVASLTMASGDAEDFLWKQFRAKGTHTIERL